MADIDKLEQETHHIREELAKVENSVQQKGEELEAIAKECQQLEKEIASQNALQSAAREEANALKKQASNMKQELGIVQITLEEQEAEEERLRGLVVSSPERRKAGVKTARDELDKIKLQVANLEQSTQNGKKSCSNLEHALKDVSDVVENLDKLQHACERHTEVNNKLENGLQGVTSQVAKQKALVEKTQEAEREVGRAEDKIQAQRKQHKIQIGALDEAQGSAKDQLLKVEKERRDGIIRLQEWEKEAQRLEDAIKFQCEQTKDETSRMIAEYKITEKKFLELDQNRMRSIRTQANLMADI